MNAYSRYTDGRAANEAITNRANYNAVMFQLLGISSRPLHPPRVGINWEHRRILHRALAQGGELAPSKKLMAAAKLSRGSSLLRWRRRGNLRQEPEVDDGVVWHIRVAPGAWRAVITELVAQGKDVACDFFFERK